MPDIPQGIKFFAHIAYFLLPLFLALVAGICLLIATLRKTITSGMAASFSALGGVVVVGSMFVAARTHGRAEMPPPTHRMSAPHAGVPQLEIERHLERATDDLRRTSEENRRLTDRIAALEKELRAARDPKVTGPQPALTQPQPQSQPEAEPDSQPK